MKTQRINQMNWKDKEDIKESVESPSDQQSCAMKIPKSCMESDKDFSEDNVKSDKFLCESDDEMSDFSSEDEISGNDGSE